MNKETTILTPNREKVLSVFESSEVRSDHYNGEDGLFCFSAFLRNIGELDFDKISVISEEHMNVIIQALSSISIPPSIVFLHGWGIEVHWTPNGFLAINSKDDYLKLALEFAKYLDELRTISFSINTGTFHDDPVTNDESVQYIERISSPKFTIENFGAIEDIEIFDFTR